MLWLISNDVLGLTDALDLSPVKKDPHHLKVDSYNALALAIPSTLTT